jgi:hypothetical protein
MPYTYLIGWSKLNIFYYGVRYAKNCSPNDLWNPYKTSSKHVKTFIEKNGEPDIIKIRKTFNDKNKARMWEEKVLKKLNVTNNDKWLNKIVGNSTFVNLGHSEETRKILSERKIGKRRSLSSCKKQSETMKISQLGSKNNSCKKIRVIDKFGDNVFGSISEYCDFRKDIPKKMYIYDRFNAFKKNIKQRTNKDIILMEKVI